jgi:hypothetical protein
MKMVRHHSEFIDHHTSEMARNRNPTIRDNFSDIVGNKVKRVRPERPATFGEQWQTIDGTDRHEIGTGVAVVEAL